MNELRIHQLAEAVDLAEQYGAYDGNIPFRYNLNPYPETNSPIRAFDRSLTIADRVRIAASDYHAKAGIAGWANLLWNDPDDIHRIREYGQSWDSYWMIRSATVRRAAQILGIAQEDAHLLFETEEAVTADGGQAAAVLRHLADTGKADWNVAKPVAAG